MLPAPRFRSTPLDLSAWIERSQPSSCQALHQLITRVRRGRDATAVTSARPASRARRAHRTGDRHGVAQHLLGHAHLRTTDAYLRRPRLDQGRASRCDLRSTNERLGVAQMARGAQRRRPESNRCRRLCRPLRSHSATSPGIARKGIDPLIRWPFPGRLAQLGERRLDKAEVTGSSPVSPITGECRKPLANAGVSAVREGSQAALWHVSGTSSRHRLARSMIAPVVGAAHTTADAQLPSWVRARLIPPRREPHAAQGGRRRWPSAVRAVLRAM